MAPVSPGMLALVLVERYWGALEKNAVYHYTNLSRSNGIVLYFWKAPTYWSRALMLTALEISRGSLGILKVDIITLILYPLWKKHIRWNTHFQSSKQWNLPSMEAAKRSFDTCNIRNIIRETTAVTGWKVRNTHQTKFVTKFRFNSNRDTKKKASEQSRRSQHTHLYILARWVSDLNIGGGVWDPQRTH